MRIENAHIKNFKLLDDIELRFSTDPANPLTVIRAENGSGKTSILHALRWAIYGKPGIPEGMRLTSTTTTPGQAVTVQVRMEFTTIDPFSGEEVRYRLIRTCEETPGEGDDVERTEDGLRLLRRTARGEEDIETGQKGLIDKLLPPNLADVFFTNGDDVQRFISGGQQAERERQAAVHDAIRQVLGLEDVEGAENHLVAVARELKRELANAGGEELKSAQEDLDGVQDKVEEKKAELSRIQNRIEEVDVQIRADERELNSLRGIGDLEAIQARIHELEYDLKNLEEQEKTIRLQMKDQLQSESLSWQLISNKLRQGLAILNKLADSKVIPSASVEVLSDRLELGVCICGETLEPGGKRHAHVECLIEDQRKVAPERQRLTALLHQARNSVRSERAAASENRSFADCAAELRKQYTHCCDMKRSKDLALGTERKKREQINEDRVQSLTKRIQENRNKRSEFDRQYGQAEGDLQALHEQMLHYKERVRNAENAATLNKTLQRHYEVANNLAELAKGTLATLKSDYVQRVSTRMNDLFLDIVGSDPEADGALFMGVEINNRYDIVIHTRGGKTLDADTELNGASQRALTLAFIWALMEVAEWEAPRIIDTPLGMTSGAVKHRMVQILTTPPGTNGLPYQVVLFMTRSEIRDIETLIDSRAGAVFTLTCSKDYPVDLVNEWGDGTPIVKACACNHKEICSICERRQDTSSNRFTKRTELPT